VMKARLFIMAASLQSQAAKFSAECP